MDMAACRVTRGAREIPLTPIQFKLLEVLMRAEGQVVRRREIVNEVWGLGTHVEENTLDSAMASLRTMLDKGHPRRLIQTVRGFGYRLDTV
jgi:two-component system copper resistance phosphate regulon response regulator CusR